MNSFNYFCTERAPLLFVLIDLMPLPVLHKPAVSVIPTQTITGLRRDRRGAICAAFKYKRMAMLVPEGIIKPQSAAQSLSPQDPPACRAVPNPLPGPPKTHPPTRRGRVWTALITVQSGRPWGGRGGRGGKWTEWLTISLMKSAPVGQHCWITNNNKGALRQTQSTNAEHVELRFLLFPICRPKFLKGEFTKCKN